MSADGMIWPAEAALERAFLTALRTDGDVQALLGSPARIFDDETQEPAFPCAFLDRHEVSERSVSGMAGQSHTITLSVRSRDGGRAAAKEVIGALRQAADNAGITLASQRVVMVQTIYSDVMRTPDLREFRGIIRVRIITEEAG